MDARTALVLPADLHQIRVHMVGVGGSGMSGLAAFLLRRGAQVSGSDAQGGPELLRLAGLGASIPSAKSTPDERLQGAHVLVRSAAVPADHPEIQAAQRLSVPVWKYAQMLGALFECCDGVAIAGTHGKSTTTAWLSYVLREAGLDPSFVIGAFVEQLGGGSGVGVGPHFIAEACEYDRSFLNLRPKRAAILNIEEDHLDYYADIREIVRAFREFTAQTTPNGLLVLNADDSRCRAVSESARCRVATFGLYAAADWQAQRLRVIDGRYAFSVHHHGAALGEVHLGLAGVHNVSNALAVLALANDCGVGWEQAAPALGAFHGARRRLELRGEANGIYVVDDYAHHPTEIRATLVAARERYQPRRLWVVFQPHQHSRTRFLLANFADSFAAADRVIVPDIYFVRDSAREREAVSAEDLVERMTARGIAAEYVADFGEIVERLVRNVAPGDVVLTMGAGNIWNVADGLLRRLRGDLPA